MTVRQGENLIAGTGGINVEIDNATITANTSDELQAIGTLNKNTASGATGVVYDWVGTQAEYAAQDIVHLHPEYVCFITDDYTSMLNRDVGEIVMSILPLPNACFHLLDGSVINGSGIYQEFVEYIGELYDTGNYPELFVTEQIWQNNVSSYGVCGKFVYTAASGNTPANVRLPKITGFIEGTTDVNALGELIQAGLPNITGEWGSSAVRPNSLDIQTGVFSNKTTKQTTYYNNATANTATTDTWGLSFDASASNSIYGNSTTVQPQSIKVLYYIVIATNVKTDIVVDIDNIVSDLNEKADRSLSNSTAISNCTSKIPQDIKLDLNNGTLTLKAGSKLYVPNGFESDGATPHFDVIVTTNDIVDYDYGNTEKEIAFILTQTASPVFSVWTNNVNIVSGSSTLDFSSYGYWGVWYDTGNNLIKVQDGTNVWKTNYGLSLPIGLISSTSSAVTSVDQVFNGFGYIGSTIFALPGVEGLAPMGFNNDGTLKNTLIKSTNVITLTSPSSITSGSYYYIAFSGADMFRLVSSHAWFDYKFNAYWNASKNKYQYGYITPIICKITSGSVSDFKIKEVASILTVDNIHIVDTYRNGTSWYRVWSDGWCEQGGHDAEGTTDYGTRTITLIKTFINTNYTVLITGQTTNTSSAGLPLTMAGIKQKSTDSFTRTTSTQTYRTDGIDWYACGYIN